MKKETKPKVKQKAKTYETLVKEADKYAALKDKYYEKSAKLGHQSNEFRKLANEQETKLIDLEKDLLKAFKKYVSVGQVYELREPLKGCPEFHSYFEVISIKEHGMYGIEYDLRLGEAYYNFQRMGVLYIAFKHLKQIHIKGMPMEKSDFDKLLLEHAANIEQACIKFAEKDPNKEKSL